MSDLFGELESVLAEKRPCLRKRLQPGLLETQIRRMLSKAKVKGDIESLVILYRWKDGTDLSNSHPPMDYRTFRSKVSFVPKQTYYFTSLERAINDFDYIRQIAKKYPTARAIVGCYFPIFWNRATGWLGLDLNGPATNRIAILRPKDETPCHEAYISFEAFISDLIRANREDDFLKCLRFGE